MNTLSQEELEQRIKEWKTGLEALEHKQVELTFQIERQKGAISGAESLLLLIAAKSRETSSTT